MKQIDKNEFFRQATIRICGSLNIEKSFKDCLEIFNTYLPVTGMYLALYEPDTGALKFLAFAANDENEERHDMFPIPEAIREQFESEWANQKEVLIIGDSETNSFTRHISEAIPIKGRSLLILSLKLEGKRLGAFTVYTEGLNQYRQEHADLLELLNEPFSIAMSNAIKHEEVLKFKDTLEDDNQYLHQELLKISGDEIIGASGGLKGVMEMVHQVGPLDSPVLLIGETGVGKEVIANAIHYSSPRKDGPFIKVNCGALPESLIDSELFGHEKGAFTGALSRKRGRFERADNGTIFLDEIGELPLQAQVKILRVIQYGEIERVGGTSPVNVNIRIISATHRNLEEMIQSNDFREDLWYRLNVFPIMIPPLRQRREDIPALVHYFAKRKADEMKLQQPPHIEHESIRKLQDYTFPGNVRELENMIERLLILGQNTQTNAGLSFDQQVSQHHNQGGGMIMMPAANKDLAPFDEMSRIYINHVLKQTNNVISGKNGAAKILQLHPNTLRGRMKKLGMI